jgi:hypothetical protein
MDSQTLTRATPRAGGSLTFRRWRAIEKEGAEPTEAERAAIAKSKATMARAAPHFRMSASRKREYAQGQRLYESLPPAAQARWAHRLPAELLAHHAATRAAARPREARPRARRPRRTSRARSPGSRDDPDEPDPPLGGLVTDRGLAARPCEECGRDFAPRRRSNARLCGAACKQKAYRRRRADRERRLLQRSEGACELVREGELDAALALSLVVWPSEELEALAGAA